LSHFVTPVISLNGTISTQYTRGFGVNEGLKTRENYVSLQTNWQMSPRSTLFVGTRWESQTSANNSIPGIESSAFSVYAGLFQRL